MNFEGHHTCFLILDYHLIYLKGDNGSLWFWDWRSGHNFQQAQTIVQPGMHIYIDTLCICRSFTLIFFFLTFFFGLYRHFYTVNLLLSGSLDSEAGIYSITYDRSGSRLITCEADKTIKMWKEDDNATPETHPVHFKPPKDMRRF